MTPDLVEGRTLLTLPLDGAGTVALQPGDIVEIDLPNGLAYVQVTHRHVSYGEVVRAIGGTVKERPRDLAELAAGPSRFHAMFPLGPACASGHIAARRAGCAKIPEPDRAFPLFKVPITGKRGEVLYWWLWDGDGLSRDPDPAIELADLPVRSILTAAEFLEKLG